MSVQAGRDSPACLDISYWVFALAETEHSLPALHDTVSIIVVHYSVAVL